MKADHLSYQRAATVSFLGLGLQIAFTLLLFLYGIFGQDPVAMTAAGIVAIGIPVWLSLAIVFDQHRRERIEAMESEAFAASDAAASSVFEEGQDELRVAARRVAWLHRFLVPGTSLIVGAFLLGFGLWRLKLGQAHLTPGEFVQPLHQTWAMVIGIVVALGGFIFARFVSGMGKQEVWANLRGGAAQAVGASLLGLTLAIGHFVNNVGPDTILRYLQIVFPIFAVMLGAEIFLNFVLNIYRPRRRGEIPRPAFESRLLGFVAAPDKIAESLSEAINYQFGLDVTGSWFYQLLSHWVLVLVLVGVLLIWGLTCFVVVQPDQVGLILRWGRIVDNEVGPGLHLKLPWPIDRLALPLYTEATGDGKEVRRTWTTTGVRTLELATPWPADDKPLLWTNEHATEERYLLVQPTKATSRVDTAAGQGSRNAQGDADQQLRDFGVVSAGIPLIYHVSDVEAFERFAPEGMREQYLKSVGQKVVFQYLSTLTVDEVLGGRRDEISRELHSRLTRAYAGLNPDEDGRPRGAGIQIDYVGIQDAHPPGSGSSEALNVARAFESVVQAEQVVVAKIEQAQEHKIRTLTRVVGTVNLAEQVVALLNEAERVKGVIRSLEILASQGEDIAERLDLERRNLIEHETRIERLIEQAGGEAAATILKAKADRWKKHMGERGRAAEHKGQVVSYHAAPSIFKATRYFQMLKEALGDSRLYITDPSVVLRVDVDLEEADIPATVFEEELEPGGQ